MPATIMPAFRAFPVEASTIGRIIASYGELEFMLALCVGLGLGQRDTGLRTLFGLRGETNRLNVADGLARYPYAQRMLLTEFGEAMEGIRRCLEIRNQFAHANWGGQEPEGLFFTDLELAAKTGDFEYLWRQVDVPLLQEQEEFFYYVSVCLLFLEQEYQLRAGSLRIQDLSMPPRREPPKLHNPPTLHIPPWLSPEQKARHKELAEAEEAGDPTPTRAHKEMEAQREKKRSQKAAHRERSLPKPPA